MRKTAVTAALMAVVFVGCFCRPAAVRASVSDSGGRRVVRADVIRGSGATRLSDVMLLFDAWAPATIDGFTWQMSPRGLDSYQTSSWTVMVDGVRIDTGEFGTTAWNRVPVHVGDIDSVEVIDLPVLHHGEFAGGGLVHVHTRRAAAGYDIGAAASTGNEAGDPGPWAYTTSATPNVDRLGPRYALRGSYGMEEWNVGASWLWDRHYPTDAAVRERTFGIAAGSYPQMTLAAVSGGFAARVLAGWHRVSFSSSRFEDLFFFKPYGREIPVVSRLTIGSLSGSVPLGGRMALDYRLSRTARGIGYRSNTFGLDFDWRTTTWLGGADISFVTSSLRHWYTAGYERVEAATGYELTQPDYHLSKLGADWEWSGRGDLSYRAGAMMSHGEGGVSVECAVGGKWRFDDANRFEANASYVERRPERDARIWYWQERGYDFLRDAGVEVTSDGSLGTSRRWAMDVEWAIEPVRFVSASVSGYYRGFSDLLLEEQAFRFDSAEQAFSGPVRLVSGREGGVAGGEVIVRGSPSPRVRLRAAYRYEHAVAGDTVFRRVWDAVPRHLFSQTVRYAPAPSLALWARFAWMSAAEWRDYDGADAETAGAYRSTLDDIVTLDLALTKWFWHGRLKGHLAVRNLLGAAPLYHPIGASFDTTVFAGIELLVGGGAGGDSCGGVGGGIGGAVRAGAGGERIDSPDAMR